ncbi:MAG: phosphatidylglycerol lysyltransferase domain-containing protein [Eubacterium sp.]|nr:phosphatidylglycerol lysyltransferase domain-containing protein [Eubacterium sp.]
MVDEKYPLREIELKDYALLQSYYELRRPETADSNLMDLFMWKEQYPTKYFLTEKGLIWVAKGQDGQYYTTVPCCKKEDLQECFLETKKFFNDVLKKKLQMYLVDQEALECLNLPKDEYVVVPDRTYADYVYDAEKLRQFSGKKYHGKKNHRNAFIRMYEGRYRFAFLNKQHENEIMEFLEEWKKGKEDTKEYELIDAEITGIKYLLKHEEVFDYKIGGVYLDEKLQGITIGNYCETEDMVYIPVEKANANVRGLYPYLCSEFLKQAFPTAGKVNREDDMGLEGLRKSKLSYHPIYLVEKYTVIQK